MGSIETQMLRTLLGTRKYLLGAQQNGFDCLVLYTRTICNTDITQKIKIIIENITKRR
jgi:hypothetical protein